MSAGIPLNAAKLETFAACLDDMTRDAPVMYACDVRRDTVLITVECSDAGAVVDAVMLVANTDEPVAVVALPIVIISGLPRYLRYSSKIPIQLKMMIAVSADEKRDAYTAFENISASTLLLLAGVLEPGGGRQPFSTVHF